MKLLLPLLALLPAAVAGDDPLAGRIAGPPVACIADVTSAEIRDARTILYAQTAARVWRTGPDRTCAALGPRTRLVVFASRPRHLCEGDRFQVFAIGSRFPSATCRFGRFVPYDRPPR